MLSRREALAAGLAVPLALAWPTSASAAPPPQPAIRPRSDWATARQGVRGKLQPETDVRFLLVHHTLTPNTDATPEAVAARIRSIHGFHTGSRGWADVAYNFFVDAQGGIWEARQGSLAGPVRGDATGGSQGFAELACFIGDFTATPPTPAAMDAMVSLLAWLAARNGLPLDDTVTFTSRGSSRWRKGAEVTTARIAGHRDMSQTECPGDALYPLVASELLPRARALLAGASPTPEPIPTVTPEPVAPPEAPVAAPSASLPLPAVVGGAVGVAAIAAAATYAGRRSAQQQDGRQTDATEHDGGAEPDEEADQGR